MVDNFTQQMQFSNDTDELLSNDPRNLVTSFLAYKIGKSFQCTYDLPCQ